MIIFGILATILLILLFIVGVTVMVIFERDKPKNIVIWSCVFLLTQFIGIIVYIIQRIIISRKKKLLEIKQSEDDIYISLSSSNMKNVDVSNKNEFFDFNKRAYGANLTSNNNYSLINSYSKFHEEIIKDITNANSYIILELNEIDFNSEFEIIELLKSKAEDGLMVKLVIDSRIPKKIAKSLKVSGVKVYKLCKFKDFCNTYNNLRNQIVIDGKIAYISNIGLNRSKIPDNNMIADMFLKLKGNVVQEIDVATHQDAVFASGKYIKYQDIKRDTLSNDNCIQFVKNEIDTDIELMLIKAICMANSKIQLELEQFVPTEAIMSLLKFAINSNIDVRLMLPIKGKKNSKYYASRAYAKELALMGANVYLYDGYINFNAIIIDSEFVLFGSYSFDRNHLKTSLQSVVVMNDSKAVSRFEKLFDTGIENSYRINNAKYMLLREKFFKNFI